MRNKTWNALYDSAMSIAVITLLASAVIFSLLLVNVLTQAPSSAQAETGPETAQAAPAPPAPEPAAESGSESVAQTQTPAAPADTQPQADAESTLPEVAAAEPDAGTQEPASEPAKAPPAPPEPEAAPVEPTGPDEALRKTRIVRFEAYGSDVNLDSDLRDYLDQVKTFLGDSPEWRLAVVGHSDSSGPREFNIDVARERAQHVARQLEAYGLSEGQLSVDSKGPDEPMVPNDSEENRAKNRRVELTLTEP